MPKQTLTVELDVPEGWELTGEWRQAKPDEMRLIDNGDAQSPMWSSACAYPILRKSWQAPRWIPDGAWLYRSDHAWYLSPREPQMCENGEWGSWSVIRAALLAALHGDTFTPPPVDKIQIKHNGGTQ